MGQVTASVTIGFAVAGAAGSNLNSSFQAEVDGREDGLNGGVSQFAPGATIAILVYKGSSVTGVTGVASAGTLSQASTISIVKTETITMAYSETFNTQFPITGSAVITWYGSTSPTVTKTSETQYTATTKQIAVGTITYTTTAQVWNLSGVPPTFPAAVAIFFATAP